MTLWGVAFASGIDGTRDWLVLAGRVTILVVLGIYIASFARKPGWLPAQDDR